MGYQIDIRKEGTIVDSFEIAAEFVVELLTWRAHNVSQSPILPVKEASHPEPIRTALGAVIDGKRPRVCSVCHKTGHRSDTCPSSGKPPRVAQQGNFAGTMHEVGEVGASAFIRIRALQKQGKSDEEIMEDEDITLGQFKAVIEAPSWARYRSRFPH